jgi:hypothetical protein
MSNMLDRHYLLIEANPNYISLMNRHGITEQEHIEERRGEAETHVNHIDLEEGQRHCTPAQRQRLRRT